MFYFISDDSWDEETLTWNNQPTQPDVGTHFHYMLIPTKNTSDPNITWKIYVTDLARQELAGDKMLTIMVRDDSLKDANCRIYSKENADALDEEKPWLIVDYTATAIEIPEKTSPPQSFVLKQNYPNPFNPETTLEFQLPKSSFVEVSVFDTRGVKIATLEQRYFIAGTHRTVWKGTDAYGKQVPSGIYFARVNAAGSSKTIKMALIK